MPEIKPGSRWRSTTCTTEAVVVKAPPGDAHLECGGQAMVAIDAEVAELGTPASGADGGTLVGKRYVDEGATIEVLCTKAGAGSLGLGGAPLTMKDAKPLPASD